MIIKSKKDTYANFVYDNRNLEEVSSYKYLGIDIRHKLNWNYSIEKRINGGWKAYFGLKNNCKATNLVMWDKRKLLFETLVTRVRVRCNRNLKNQASLNLLGFFEILMQNILH